MSWTLACCLPLPLVVALPSETRTAARRSDDAPMSMELVEPDRLRQPELVLAAPHEGYDLRTEEIAREVGRRLGADVAVARNFRKPKLGRFLNVNRPTESALEDTTASSGERVTDAARDVFRRWLSLIQRGSSAPIPLYVEVHGFNDTVAIGGQDVSLEVVELATVGIDASEAGRIRQAWTRLEGELGLPPLAIDVLDPDYLFAGERVSFCHTASMAKQLGSLQPCYVEQALHFELPPSARASSGVRRDVARAIAASIEAVQPAPARGR